MPLKVKVVDMNIKLTIAVLSGIFALLMQSEASAGLITASIFPGETAQVAWRDINAPIDPSNHLVVTDTDNDGVVQFIIPSADQANPSLLVALCGPAPFEGGIADISAQGTESFEAPLSVFEPFRFAAFTPQN